jgi:hypothetical protein
VQERPDDVRLSWEEIHRRGRGWVGRVRTGLESLGRLSRDVGAAVRSLIAK